jgi:Domain of unknown function (DUF4177)
MNQNVYPAHSEDVLAALPIRATRGLMNANYTAFFNPKAQDALRAVSLATWHIRDYTMKKYVAILLVASALSLAGCMTPHALKWEYKVAWLARGGDANRAEGPQELHQAQENLLNNLGKEGWMLVSQTDGRVFYLKRAVR